jgi:hypothetical protein
MSADRLIIAAAIVVVAVVVALAVRRWRRPDAPTQVSRAVPSQLDRADFDRPDAAWLVVVFTSATCDTCAGVVAAAQPLAAADVAVVDVEYPTQRSVHERYRIEAVPMVVFADAAGAVRGSRLGPVSAADLAAGLSELRAPR